MNRFITISLLACLMVPSVLLANTSSDFEGQHIDAVSQTGATSEATTHTHSGKVRGGSASEAHKGSLHACAACGGIRGMNRVSHGRIRI